MTTKEKLLSMLTEKKGDWLSGEEAGETLLISRAAVWKAVGALRDEGYVIDAVRKKGYRLCEENDTLSASGILCRLSAECRMLDIHVLESVSSTNAILWEKASAGAPEGEVLAASMQTDGKGRMGRRFYSPAETGLYMSILLRPAALDPSRAVRLTTMAAVAACEAFEAASGRSAMIKWVNDIIMDGRKVCGILTEGSISMETGLMETVILGIGINAYSPEGGFPPEILTVAGPVFEKRRPDGKNILAAGFLNRFMHYYLSANGSEYVEAYRSRSLAVGKRITVFSGNQCRNAAAVDVDEECRLVVQYDDGRSEHLSAGEISIMLQQ